MIVVAALYKFVSLPDYRELQPKILESCLNAEVKGTLLLAEEGINGTIAGTRDAIDLILAKLHSDSRFSDIEVKESHTEEMPFFIEPRSVLKKKLLL